MHCNLSRRDLVQKLGIGTATLAVGLSLPGPAEALHRHSRHRHTKDTPTQTGAVTDVDILNFALNLEYLEAEYYTFATTGGSIEDLGIPTNGTGTPGPIVIKPNPKVPFACPNVRQYANEIALDERRHVLFIRNTLAALGAQPVVRPAVDLLNSFKALAQLAGLASDFDPFSSDLNFLLGAYIFEDVGVSANRGLAPLIQGKEVLSGAAGILGAEAYHASLIRTNLFEQKQGPATDAISGVRKALGDSVDYGVADGPLAEGPAGEASIVLADSNALVPSRTPRQVLNIVYGGVNAPGGLFFPNGANGNIR